MSLHETRKIRNAVMVQEMEEWASIRDDHEYRIKHERDAEIIALKNELHAEKVKIWNLYKYVNNRRKSAERSLLKYPNNREALGKLSLCNDILKEIDGEPTKISELLETYSKGGKNRK